MTQDLALEAPELFDIYGENHGHEVLIARDKATVDMDAAQRAAADFLAALGIELGEEGLRETPARMARPTRSCSTRSRCG